MEDIELIKKINKKLAKNDFRIYQNGRIGVIINLKEFNFEQIFGIVAEDCGFGNNKGEWDFIGDVKKAEELKKAYSICDKSIIEDLEKYEAEKEEIFSSLKSSEIKIPLCDWELIKISNIDSIEYCTDEKGTNKNLIFIAQTVPTQERRYKNFLFFNIKKNNFGIYDYDAFNNLVEVKY